MIGRIVATWAINIANSIVFLASGGRKVLHEGRYRRGTWVDWYRVFHCRPRDYAEPATEAEICSLVANASRVRVVGAGHSFNPAPVSDELLISLDRFTTRRCATTPPARAARSPMCRPASACATSTRWPLPTGRRCRLRAPPTPRASAG